MFSSLLETVTQLVTSPWIYAVLGAMILVDVYVPVLPTGTLLVTSAIHAADGTVSALGLIAVAVAASVAGDALGYMLGRRAGGRWLSRWLKPHRQATITRIIDSRGVWLTVFSRFVAAGRTMAAFSAANSGVPIRRYLTWSALAAVSWGVYGVALGYLNGTWLGTGWVGLVVAVGFAATNAAIIAHAYRRFAVA